MAIDITGVAMVRDKNTVKLQTGASMHCFLSHSSKDKKNYVAILAEKFGDRAIYDEYTFEAGMKTLDEIMKNLQRTDLFVLLISSDALDSEWVKTEISHSSSLINKGLIKQFLPIIIDNSITYKDDRIPDWIKDQYNLRVIPRPNVAFRTINSAFSRLSIDANPKSLKSKRLFVGRNDQMKDLEGRLDDYEKPLPCAIVASGLREIGRKKLLLHALKKSNRIDEHHQPIIIPVQAEDGIDGFLSKFLDLGFSSKYTSALDLGKTPLEEKVSIIAEMFVELGKQNEVLLIDDWRCIVQFGGVYADWFLKVCEALPRNRIYACVASASSPSASLYRKNDKLYHIRVPELNEAERIGLLVRYLRDVEGVEEADTSRLQPFKNLLNGYPEQAIYAGEIIKTDGIAGAIARSPEIVDYARLKASVYVERYRDDELRFDLLTLLSWFEFISLDFITKIADELSVDLLSIVNEFIEAGLCQIIGSLGEYVRLNDVIRDYVARGSIRIPDRFSKAITVISKDVLSSGNGSEDFDYSEKSVAIRVALLEGKHVPENMLIPAHFLNAIAQNYKNKRYKDVIELSERILPRGNYEDYIRNQIMHFYCMSLARRRDTRFTSEVMKIRGKEHDYVFGFYYRLSGRYDEALQRFSSAMEEKRWEENCKREIVLIYNLTENYDAAFNLAKESFYNFPSNPISVLAYFEVLLNQYKINIGNESELISEMGAALVAISRIASDKGQEVEACMQARYQFYVKDDPSIALDIVEQAVMQFARSPYPLLVKMELGISMKSADIIDEALAAFEQKNFDEKQGVTERKKAALFLMALTGQSAQAIRLADRDLSQINAVARERFKQRLASV